MHFENFEVTREGIIFADVAGEHEGSFFVGSNAFGEDFGSTESRIAVHCYGQNGEADPPSAERLEAGEQNLTAYITPDAKLPGVYAVAKDVYVSFTASRNHDGSMAGSRTVAGPTTLREYVPAPHNL